jgi:hypothetical protein
MHGSGGRKPKIHLPLFRADGEVFLLLDMIPSETGLLFLGTRVNGEAVVSLGSPAEIVDHRGDEYRIPYFWDGARILVPASDLGKVAEFRFGEIGRMLSGLGLSVSVLRG